MMDMNWEDINTQIDRNGPEILRRLFPILMSPDVLRQLVQGQVLLDHQEQTLRYTQDPATRCAHFMDLLKGGSVQTYYSFVEVARQNNHFDLVRLLGGTVNESEVRQPDATTSQPTPTAQQPTEMEQHMEVQTEESETPLWNKRHPGGQNMLLNKPDLGRKLDIALPDLKKLVRPSALWANLQKYAVMDILDIEQCQVSGVRGTQVEAVVNYLKQDQIWKLHAFFRALAQIQQDHLIDMVLGDGAKEAYNKNLLNERLSE